MMKKKLIAIDYLEINAGISSKDHLLPSLRDFLTTEAHPDEENISKYLENAPAYAGLGKTVGDVLDPDAKVTLFPGTRTDGTYIWPSELAYYVRKYHLRLSSDFVERMASLNWKPPLKNAINWDNMDEGFAT